MAVVRQKILAAFLTRNEVLAQAQMLTAMSDALAMARFWADYTTARTKLSTIQPMPTTAPEIRPLPSAARSHLDQVEASDSFQESFGGFGYSFHLVPIDRLTPIQTFCNLEPEIPPPDPDDLDAGLEYALPRDSIVPGEVTITPTGIRFSSPRYGMGLQHVRRRIREGKAVLSLEHPNLVQIRKFGNVLVLANGTHRAFEMARNGRTHTPAIVIEHRNPAEFEWPTGPGFFNPQFLIASPRQPVQGARPPLLLDFLTELAVECSVNVLPSVVDFNIGAASASQAPGAQQIAIQLGGLVPQQAP
jgi:hypothetical protein